MRATNVRLIGREKKVEEKSRGDSRPYVTPHALAAAITPCGTHTAGPDKRAESEYTVRLGTRRRKYNLPSHTQLGAQYNVHQSSRL